MPASEFPNIKCVLIFKADRLHAEGLRQSALQVFTQARAVVVHTTEAARKALSANEVDVFVAGAGSTVETDVVDLLAQSASNTAARFPRVLIVTVRREYRMLAGLRALSVDGVFDSGTESPVQFAAALRDVASGKRYWSQSLVEQMTRLSTGPTALFRLLTAFEQLVLAVIGDGCDNVVAAEELKLSPATVSTVRREIHRKLGVQHRGELVRMAAQHGFIRFTSVGVVRPGYAFMRETYQARRAKLNSPRHTKLAEPTAGGTPV